jgi:hypothetical protein
MKTFFLFNIINHRQENKTETSKPNLTNVASLFLDLIFIEFIYEKSLSTVALDDGKTKICSYKKKMRSLEKQIHQQRSCDSLRLNKI